MPAPVFVAGILFARVTHGRSDIEGEQDGAKGSGRAGGGGRAAARAGGARAGGAAREAEPRGALGFTTPARAFRAMSGDDVAALPDAYGVEDVPLERGHGPGNSFHGTFHGKSP